MFKRLRALFRRRAARHSSPGDLTVDIDEFSRLLNGSRDDLKMLAALLSKQATTRTL
jgi:hypothetical protein